MSKKVVPEKFSTRLYVPVALDTGRAATPKRANNRCSDIVSEGEYVAS